MARPVKWARDLHLLRERAARSRTETWSRQDVERLFGVGRATAQSLMKAIGGIQTVAGAHFVERSSLLAFLDEAVAAPTVDDVLTTRLREAAPVPRPKALRVALPTDLRHTMLPDLPQNVTVEAGRIEVRAETAVEMLEGLVALAMVMQNDLERFCEVIEPPTIRAVDSEELQELFASWRVRTPKPELNTKQGTVEAK